MPSLLNTLAPLSPEIIVAIGAMALLMWGVFRDPGTLVVSARGQGGRSMAAQPKPGESSRIITWAAIVVLLAAAVDVYIQHDLKEVAFGGAFLVDPFARFAKILVLLASAGALVLSLSDDRAGERGTAGDANAGQARAHAVTGDNLGRFEYPVLVLLSATGMMMMISANDLISLYVGLELQSLALYVLAAFRRDSLRSSEAGLKYFVLGALSSGMLLYGASMIYGFTGSTAFPTIAGSIKAQLAGGTTLNIGLIFGLVFLLAGIAFKISAVPFHMWTPDVYEGAPTPVTAFFAAAPKVAAMALFVRISYSAFADIAWQWQQIVYLLAIASMVLGAFAAIGQTNIKRLLAYSSIANVGFMLVGLVANTADGARGVLVYLAIYVVMTLGSFACVLCMRRGDQPIEDVDQLAGLARNDLTLAACFAILLFSFIGIPPLAGFFAKFFVFQAAVSAGHYVLAVLGVLASAVGAYYYLRLIKIMFFDEPVAKFDRAPFSLRLMLGLAAVFMVAFVLYPAPLVRAAELASKSFF
jgi:NADH-quinone oxidoreductase subunit N